MHTNSHKNDTHGHVCSGKHTGNRITQIKSLFDKRELTKGDASHRNAGFKPELQTTDVDARRRTTYRHGYIKAVTACAGLPAEDGTPELAALGPVVQ